VRDFGRNALAPSQPVAIEVIGGSIFGGLVSTMVAHPLKQVVARVTGVLNG